MTRFQLRSGLTAVCAVAAIQAAGAEPFAYVPNEKSGTVSVIDTATDAVVGDFAQ